jgi:hypothetical protein
LWRVLDRESFEKTKELAFLPHDDIVARWSDEEIISALVSFLYASKIIFHECEEWAMKFSS